MSKINAPVTYMGDAVYVQAVQGAIVLTTGSHIREEADQTIIMESSVLSELIGYLSRHGLIPSLESP